MKQQQQQLTALLCEYFLCNCLVNACLVHHFLVDSCMILILFLPTKQLIMMKQQELQLRGKLLVYNLFGTAHVCWFYSCQPMEQKHQELTALLWVDFLFIILCKLLQEQGERYRKTILVGFLPTKNMKQHKEELPCYTVWDFVVKFLCRLLEVTCCIER